MSETAFHILALDDEPEVLRGLSRLLRRRGFDIAPHHTAAEALASLGDRGHRYDMVLLDLNMPDRHGLDVLGDIREIDPAIPVVVLTGDSSAESAIAALQGGAFNYLLKPLVDPDAAALTLSNACHFGRLKRRADELERQVSGGSDIVGSGRAMEVVHQLVERVATTDVNVLILGESGTGKELVARRIHHRSGRKNAPFVALNCGAFPETMIDSELFGHERGAFTGAVRARPGAFVEADGGTLFLDEVGEIPIGIQPRLLRALQEGEVRQVGGTGVRPIDVRVVAATNVDLHRAIAAREFREDLYYRLDVITIALPPLRERLEDLPALLAHLVEKHSRAQGRDTPPEVTGSALAALLDHRWPGNVRELENVVQRALALCGDAPVELEHLPPELRQARRAPAPAAPPSDRAPNGGPSADNLAWTDELSFKEARKQAQTNFEIAYLERLLRQTDGNVSEAARRAGLDRSNFRRILNRLDIKP